jgi:lysyl-tRNA synthetase
MSEKTPQGAATPTTESTEGAEQKLFNERQAKVKQLEALGVNPYGNGFAPTSLAGEIRKRYQDADAAAIEAENPAPFTLAGRVVAIRSKGKAAFVDIQDRSGGMQLHLKKDVLGEDVFKVFELVDIADFIGVTGTLFKSRAGELTLAVKSLRFLGKALRPLPGKFIGEDKITLTPAQAARVKQAADAIMTVVNATPHESRETARAAAIQAQGENLKDDPVAVKALPHAVSKAWAESQALSDTEERYRRRYVDLLSNPSVRDTFKKRTKLVQFIRNYLDARDFLEVETPMLHSLVSGAAAKPFKTHHNALGMELFMRIAPELHLKRLVVGGFDRVYEINRNFRNEGLSTRHNPEFTMLEFYQAYATYEDLMDLTEDMISQAAVAVCGSSSVKYGEHTIDFKKGWPRIPMTESISQRVKDLAPADFSDAEKLRAVAVRRADDKEKVAIATMNKGELIGTLFEQYVEGELVQPTFITQFPVELSPLARRNDANPAITDRFELFCVGREIANAFSELNDPVDQAGRFQAQVDAKGRGQQETMDYDQDYIRALEHGLPPTAGEGIGIDRLAMLLTDAQSIKDVILFPLLKPQK